MCVCVCVCICVWCVYVCVVCVCVCVCVWCVCVYVGVCCVFCMCVCVCTLALVIQQTDPMSSTHAPYRHLWPLCSYLIISHLTLSLILSYIISHYLSYYLTLSHIISHYISYYITLSHIISHYLILSYIISHYLSYYLTLSHIISQTAGFSGRVFYINVFFFQFCVQFLSEIFIILRIIPLDITINVRLYSCKVLAFLSDFNNTRIFIPDFRKAFRHQIP